MTSGASGQCPFVLRRGLLNSELCRMLRTRPDAYRKLRGTFHCFTVLRKPGATENR